MTISLEMPFSIARNVASASSSEMFTAMVNPSHQRLDAGVVPPATVIAPTGSVPETTSSVDPSSSSNWPIDEPHICAMARLPDSQIGATTPVL